MGRKQISGLGVRGFGPTRYEISEGRIKKSNPKPKINGNPLIDAFSGLALKSTQNVSANPADFRATGYHRQPNTQAQENATAQELKEIFSPPSVAPEAMLVDSVSQEIKPELLNSSESAGIITARAQAALSPTSNSLELKALSLPSTLTDSRESSSSAFTRWMGR